MSLKLTRASGAQNTFFIANVFDVEIAAFFSRMTKEGKKNLARQVCLGFDGFKTDGLLFLCPHSQYDFSWEFFNSDGSFAEMCGNAARCAALFYYKKVKQKSQLRFDTGAGVIEATILEDNKIKVEMTPFSKPRSMEVLAHEGLFINTGVPHFVLCQEPNGDLAKRLRTVSDFGSAGANITFIEVLGTKEVKAITFERGVEGFTQACGTGAVAAAVYLNQQQNCSEVRVLMPGGDLLIENITEGRRPFLTGPAKLEFDLINFEENSDGKKT